MGLFDIFKKSGDSLPITLWKDKRTGMTRWLAAYSSNYLDDDFPSDILSEKAHLEFIDAVEKGELPYPELWLWHLKDTAVGVADKLFYDNEYGIAMASGVIHKGKEHIVRNISRMPVQLGTSHGMTFVERNKDDTKVIDKYVTIEISILPLVAAANKMTSFYILDKEKKMMSTEQKEFLKDSGMSEDDIAKVEARNKQAADENSLRERKAAEEQPQEEVVIAEEKAEEVTEEKQEEPEHEQTESKEQSEEVVDDDAQTVTVGQLKSTMEYLVQTVTERISAMEEAFNKSIAEIAVKNDQLEKAVNEQTLTPGASLSSIIGKSLIDKSLSKSASGSVELSKEDPLYNDAPAETPAPEKSNGISLQSIIKNITGAQN